MKSAFYIIVALVVISLGLTIFGIVIDFREMSDRAAFADMCKTMDGVPVLGLDGSNVCLKQDALRAQ